MSEIGDVANWVNILIPVIIPIVSIAFVYMKKVDKSMVDLSSMKEDVERLKSDVRYLFTEKHKREGLD
jgi:hypothetical protein